MDHHFLAHERTPESITAWFRSLPAAGDLEGLPMDGVIDAELIDAELVEAADAP